MATHPRADGKVPQTQHFPNGAFFPASLLMVAEQTHVSSSRGHKEHPWYLLGAGCVLAFTFSPSPELGEVTVPGLAFVVGLPRTVHHVRHLRSPSGFRSGLRPRKPHGEQYERSPLAERTSERALVVRWERWWAPGNREPRPPPTGAGGAVSPRTS